MVQGLKNIKKAMEQTKQNPGEQLSQQMTQETLPSSTAIESSVQTLEQNKVENGTDGSLGKFKDTSSLLEAYNNLQAEFTKKCQALSEAKKQLEASNVPPPSVEVDNKTAQEEVLPIYSREDWAQKVSEFLQQNQHAQAYAGQIAQKIMEDESLATNSAALDLAFAKILASSAVLPEKAVEDEKFVNNYVLKSEKIKNAVLQEYLKQLKQNQPPSLMGSNSSKQVLYGVKQATTLSEAKQVLKQMLS